MIRTLMAAAAVYALGHPSFDRYRPAFLDQPLQGFYFEVNFAARDGQRALQTLDTAPARRYVETYIERTQAELRSASLLHSGGSDPAAEPR